MAKHKLAQDHPRHFLSDRKSQEIIGVTHAVNCSPKHVAGRYSKGEWEEQINYGIAGFNARQSTFYEKNDRTEDARPDEQIRYYSGDEEEEY
jgi:IS30 family transposase